MPITINGSGTITGLSAGGLPDGTVAPADLTTGGPYWDSSGNVGIGTSSPQKKFAVSDSGTTGFEISPNEGGSNSIRLIAFNRSTPAYVPCGIEGSVLTFSTTPGAGLFERARIDSSGNLQIGRTASGANTAGNQLAPLTNTNNAQAYNESVSPDTNGLALWYLNRTGSDGQIFQFRRNGTAVGSVSITTTATTYSTSSDYRLKENIQPMIGALAKVAALRPVTYKWKANGSDGEGFIAHELAEVVPQCVTGEKDAVDADGNPVYQGIDTSFLVATLTAAIQEQQAMIEELNAKVEAQAAEIAALKGVQA